jgi:hypothetical protein
MLRRAAVLVFPALMLAACGTTMQMPGYRPPPEAPPPPPGAIQGHGAFRLSSGLRATCAGFSVALMPDLPRYEHRIQALYGSTGRVMEPVSEVKARSAKLPPSPETAPIASASCDAHGEFSFASLAPGTAFLIAHVKIHPAENGRDDYVILQPVSVRSGQAVDVSLAP